MVDRSGSIAQTDYNAAIDFIYNVTTWLTIGSTDIYISIVTYSSSYTEEFDLNDYTNKQNLLSAIKTLKGTSTGGSTYTQTALNFVRTTSFTSAHGSRSGTSPVVVVMTDGVSNSMTSTVQSADDIRTQHSAEIFAVGIGSALSSTNAEIKGIASDPDSDYVHYVEGYIYLCNLIPSLVPKLGKIC